MYQEINSNDLWPQQAAGNRVDQWYQRLLFSNFSDATAKKLYGATIRTIAIFLKLGIVLSLPFKFLQFFRQSMAEQKNKTNRDK